MRRATLLAFLSISCVWPALGQTQEKLLEPCLACHGPNGQSQVPNTPSLGGQPAFFAMAQLFLYREERRPDLQMAPMAKGMSDDDLRKYSAISHYRTSILGPEF